MHAFDYCLLNGPHQNPILIDRFNIQARPFNAHQFLLRISLKLIVILSKLKC